MTTEDEGPDTSGLRALRAGDTEYRFDHPDAAVLDTFENQHPDRPWVVGLDCTEFTSICPVTGQPDFGRILIEYVPRRLCVESKSLKLYLFSYRNHGAFHEACVNRIADDLAARLAPHVLRVRGDFNVRGGIAIRPLALRWGSGADGSEVDRTEALLLLDQYDRWPHQR